jgi:alkaline phosphatase D
LPLSCSSFQRRRPRSRVSRWALRSARAPIRQTAADLGRCRRQQARVVPVHRRYHLRRHQGHGRHAGQYDKLAGLPGYQKLLKTCPLLATWDDHDYGGNDAGTDYPKKIESQQILLDFLGEPRDSPRRKQEGIYHARVFGPSGKRTQVILLDTRYFRSALKKKEKFIPSEGGYIPNTDPDATFLGAPQWKWLEEQLRVPAELRLLVSSIQVVAEDHGHEKWMNIPSERERLFKLLADTRAGGAVILSGDRHLAELSVMDAGLGYPLYDLTASGLNQASRRWQTGNQPHRVATMNFGDHFGMVTVDWERADPIVGLQIRDADGDVTIQRRCR